MTADSGKNPALHAALILIGFTSVIAQIVLMRELIVVFLGNEISLGIILANWLLWTSLGSGPCGRLVSHATQARRWVAGLELALAVLLPLTITAVRSVPLLLHAAPGEVIGPGPMFLTSFLVMSLFCITCGCLFAAGSRLYESEKHTSVTQATGFVYLVEAVGSAAGGLVSSVVLIRYFSSYEIGFLLTVLNVAAAAVLSVHSPSLRAKVAGGFFFCAAIAAAFPGGRAMENKTLRFLWHDLEVRAVRNSIYGNLVVIDTEGAQSVAQNGKVLFSDPDPEAAEENVHYALLQHPAPRSLLLIGGGMNGSLMEALRHPTLQHIDYVEPDPALFKLYADYFAEEWSTVRSDPRIAIHRADGRFFLQRSANRYDVIIPNLPDPQTAQLNRFYTEEFFRSAERHLAHGGIFSFQVTGAENYISDELAAFLRCLNKTLGAVFPDVQYLPGANIHFFASPAESVLVTDADVLVRRLRARHLQTRYVSEYSIPFRMMPDRMEQLRSAILAATAAPVNRDFTPIAYYFDVELWSTRFHTAYRRLFHAIAAIGFRWVMAAAAGVLLGIIALILHRRDPGRLRATAGVCTAGMGFTQMGVEVLLLLAFQAIYGYVYHQLAVIIAAFMAGMALGGRVSLRRFARAGADISIPHLAKVLIAVQAIAVVLPVLLVALFQALEGVSGRAGLIVIANVLFPLAALLSGGLGGYQFPICSRIYFSARREGQGGLGSVYAFDLVGACIGAILFSTFLIPLFGFLKTALLTAAVNVAPLWLLRGALAERKSSSGR